MDDELREFLNPDMMDKGVQDPTYKTGSKTSVINPDEMLSWFSLGPEVSNIFTVNMITSPAEIINTLEIYKFVPREDLIRILNRHRFTEIPFSSLDAHETDAQFRSVEQKFNVFIVPTGSQILNIYINSLDDINVNSLELELSMYSLRLYRITSYNFAVLTDKSYRPVYDPMIMFKRILIEALRVGATDLHFDVLHFDLHAEYPVRCRIDTDMVDISLFRLDERLNREMIGKLIESKTGATSIDLNDPSGVTATVDNIFGTNDLELRVSAGKCVDGFHYVIRIQKKETFSFMLDNLGFHENVLEDLASITRKLSGATVITGAVRTGKNTTAFALANEMLKRPIKVISYEYPVEVLMPMTQVNYMNDDEILLNAIRLAKKQDANVAFLNEIPNKEVAFAIQDLVNSSIHVITTMHLDRLWLFPYRLKEYYGDSYKDIISQINGIFNQKMFSVCCPHCQQQMLVADIKDSAKRSLLEDAGIKDVHVNMGCRSCNGTGKITGMNQPYAEHLLFDLDLIDDLLQCDAPYQMEMILRKELFKRRQNLERYMVEGIQAGKLSLDALDAVV